MWKALIKSVLSILMIIGLSLPVGAECVVAKNSEGLYTHICDDYKSASYPVPSEVGNALIGPRETVSKPIPYADDSYMMDFANDTIGQNMDFGAEDDPGIGADFGSDSSHDF